MYRVNIYSTDCTLHMHWLSLKQDHGIADNFRLPNLGLSISTIVRTIYTYMGRSTMGACNLYYALYVHTFNTAFFFKHSHTFFACQKNDTTKFLLGKRDFWNSLVFNVRFTFAFIASIGGGGVTSGFPIVIIKLETFRGGRCPCLQSSHCFLYERFLPEKFLQ